MSFAECTVADFTARLASPAPVPGGGGASALAGAVGVALGDMVGELTVGKPKYAALEGELRALMARAQDLRQRLLDCVDRDAAAFEPLSRAYAIPRDDPRRPEILERCLREAAAAPLEIFDLCCQAIELQADFAEAGSPLVLSDAATGAALCRAALEGAAVNVKVNTKPMRDRAHAEAVNRHVDEGLARYRSMADRVYETVYRRFC